MLNRVPISIAAFLFAASTAIAQQTTKSAQPTKAPSAQQPKPAVEAEEKAPVKTPEPPPQPVNIKIDVTITDQTGPGEPTKKVISMITGDRQNNSIRSTANVLVQTAPAVEGAPKSFNWREVRINVDARPALVKDGKISMNFGLEYLPRGGPEGGRGSVEGMASLNERLGLILESGKPMMVSQAADPTSDRRITVEVTATILK